MLGAPWSTAGCAPIGLSVVLDGQIVARPPRALKKINGLSRGSNRRMTMLTIGRSTPVLRARRAVLRPPGRERRDSPNSELPRLGNGLAGVSRDWWWSGEMIPSVRV